MACYLFFTMTPGFAFSNIFIPFFLGGFLLKDILKKRSDNKSIFILAVSDLLLVSLWKPDYCYVRENMHLVPYLVRTAIGLCTSSLIILSLMCFYEMKDNLKKIRSSKIVAYFGTITLGIYLSHDLFYKGFLGQIASLFIMEGNLVVLFIYALLVFLASAGLVAIIRKNKYLNLIFLGKKL